MSALYQLIEANQAQYPVRALCKTLRVAVSGFYRWKKRLLSLRQQENQMLMHKIQSIHDTSYGSYGSIRICKALRLKGYCINRKRVVRLMRLIGIQGQTRRRKYRSSTPSALCRAGIKDLVLRQFYASSPNQLWVADMTYLPTAEGFLFLAIIMDVWSRKIISYTFGTEMTRHLVITALQQAVKSRRPRAVIHHSDRGVQYTSSDFIHACQHFNVKPSVGQVGCAYDNAMAESFFASLKSEFVSQQRWKTRDSLRLAVFTWIEAWYNARRLHSALGYRSPNHFELAYSH